MVTTPPSEAKCETCGGSKRVHVVVPNYPLATDDCPDCAALPEQVTRELKPCPFCAGPAKLIGAGAWALCRAAYCEKCEITGPMQSTEEMAVEAWNSRSAPLALTEALRFVDFDKAAREWIEESGVMLEWSAVKRAFKAGADMVADRVAAKGVSK